MAQPPRQTTPFNAIGNNKAQDHATMLNGDSSSYNKVGYINSIQQVQIFHQQVCAAAGGSSLGSDHHLQESGVSTVVTSEKPDLDTYIGEFVELGRLISLGYQNLHRTAKPYRPFFKEIRTKVTEQDLKLESLNRSLVHALQQRKSFLISGPSMLEETLKRIRGAVNQDMQQALSKCVIELQVSLPLDKDNMQSYGN
ncbi:hypothetical protein CH63R_10487 [Colletotrichum higginsianum IMI 349063]|uniref:Uncharacterized protein n=1 Tax=Colletotrichum higginsianum (strain IMI 349063) TaxID=759273 RepID=A0A1B7Y2Y3_COLHI|nr:uncharacterized protein CH63R_10487 [Colletotrichum higginsianum IMI 349063]OBR06367.1 hypothetical protein CH63R_10487 [Colletotrichum higginsianum IMI 349063]